MDFRYTYGIEEEFFLVDPASRDLVPQVPRAFVRRCRRQLGEVVQHELLQSQVEIATPVLASAAQARQVLGELRQGVAAVAATRELRLVAAGTHPLAGWQEQQPTAQPRYAGLLDDFQIVGRRNLLCALHVHVAVPPQVDRVGLLNRLLRWTPLLLALSTSSPFWQGRATGLLGYRQSAYDEWPRSGIPDFFDDESRYAAFVELLVRCGAIEDASFLWWAIRPSPRYPTLELRICDACTCIEDSLALAAAFRCLVSAHVRRPGLGRVRSDLTRRVIDENRWRAKRHGPLASFIDERQGRLAGCAEVLAELTELVAPDAAVLGCEREIGHLSSMQRCGSSAQHQLQLYQQRRAQGDSRVAALRQVVDWLVETTAAGPATGGHQHYDCGAAKA